MLAFRAARVRPLLVLAAAFALASCGSGGADPVGPVRPADPNRYSEAELAYFGEIAFGFEFGDASPVVRKWQTDVRVAVHGDPTAEDREALATVMRELTAAIGGPVRVADAGAEPANADVYYVPRARFTAVYSQAVPNNDGEFWVSWDGTDHLTHALVLIGTDVEARFRRHLIREELTQSMGLAQDSPRYPDSMFYSGYTDTPAYSAMDRALIEMLYRDEVQAGMTDWQAASVLRTLTRRPATVAGLGGGVASRAPWAGRGTTPGVVVGVGGGSGGSAGGAWRVGGPAWGAAAGAYLAH